jgi:uncharacterized metal-binding protein
MASSQNEPPVFKCTGCSYPTDRPEEFSVREDKEGVDYLWCDWCLGGDLQRVMLSPACLVSLISTDQHGSSQEAGE